MKPKSILILSAIFLGLLSSCGTSSTANNISMKQTIWKNSSAIMKLTIEEEDYQKLSFDTPLTLGFTIAISGVDKERILQRIEVTI